MKSIIARLAHDKPDNYLDSCGVEPEVVAEHEQQPKDEGEVVRSQGWQNVPNSRQFNCLKKSKYSETTMWWTGCGRTRQG